MKSASIDTRPSCADDQESGALRFEEARRRILADIRPIEGYEKVPLTEAGNRVLHRPVVSSVDVPAHTNSAVDGYALRGADLPPQGQSAVLEIAGAALAGNPFQGEVAAGECVRITTGAQMPQGSDTVLMQEHVEREGETIRLDDRHRPGQNVRQAGEDLRAGETVLAPGRRLTPADIGLIASLGIGEIDVKRRLRVAISSTGDEVRPLGETLPAGGIYDSNRYTLGAALARLGAETISLGIIPDDREALLRIFTEAAHNADVILSSGGVSAGEADYTKEALGAAGSVAFWKVAIKPGRPLAFGRIGDALFFGLPGNPVAVMVTFYQFVLPALEKKMGVEEKPPAPIIQARSLDRIRKNPGRTEFLRGIIEQTAEGEWTVRTTGKQGSGILRSMSLANAFIVLSHESGDVDPGDRVTVQPFAGLI